MAVNVLVVDDSAVMRSMIQKTLLLSGLQVGEIHQAANGREGLDALGAAVDRSCHRRHQHAGDDGRGDDRADADQSNLKTIPTVVVSTEGSQTRIERLQGKGVRFIHKPFTPEMIRDTVKEVLGSEVFHERSQ